MQENGYVEMVVRYAEKPSIHRLIEEYVVGGDFEMPATPEYVRSALTGTVLVVYDAFALSDDSESVERQCSSSYRFLQVESRAAKIDWTDESTSEFSDGEIAFATDADEILLETSNPLATRYGRMGGSIQLAMNFEQYAEVALAPPSWQM